MKKLSKLTLKDMADQRMSDLEMNAITGGLVTCGCGCHYSSSGGSGTYDNAEANREGNKFSYDGSRYLYCVDPEDPGWKDGYYWGAGL